MKRLHISSLLYLLPAILALLFLRTGGIANAATYLKGTWQIVPSPNVGSGYNTLNDVSATATNDVWVVGYGQNGLVEHWDGTQWSIVFKQGFNFTAVTAITNKDVWAVGYLLHNGVQRPLLEHWNGITWGKVASPNPGGLSEARGLTAISPHNVWAVGYNNPNTLTEHWNGNGWSIVASPNGGSLGNFLLATTRISGTKQVIAVGYYYIPNSNPESIGTAQTLVESYS